MPYGVFSKRLELLSTQQVETIKEKSLDILEEVGFAYRHPNALKLLEENGAIIDYRNEVAKIPRYLVLECIHKAPKNYVINASSRGSVNYGDGKLKTTMCLESAR